MSNVVLRVSNLTKDYGVFRAVDNISFEIKAGQILGLLGPNGAGKSTTIQMLIGITEPTAGQISYFGLDFKKHRRQCLGRINYTSAYSSLQWRISVKESLLVFAGLYDIKEPHAKMAGLLEYFEISHLANQKYGKLSAGEKTRVGLVKSLLNDPELILMDEPTASLDPDIADKTLSLIEDLRSRRNLSILFTSHNMAEVERVCDEVAFLSKGQIVSHATPANHTKRFNEVEVGLNFRGEKAELEKLLIAADVSYNFLAPNHVFLKTTKSKVGELIAAVEAKSFKIVDVEVRRPDLEDVFLEIARSK